MPLISSTSSAFKSLPRVDGWSRNGVACYSWIVDADDDTGMVGWVGTRELDGSRIGTSTSSNCELTASHIKLSTTWRASTVKGDDFRSNKVVASSDVAWNARAVLATVGNESVDTPSTTRVAIVVDLEPVQAARVSSRKSIRNLSQVGNDGPFVAGVNGLR